MNKLITFSILSIVIVGLNSKEVSAVRETELDRAISVEEAISVEPTERTVAYHTENIGETSNLTEQEMRKVLEEAPKNTLAKYAKYFVEAEKKFKINAFALAAIVAQESGWGESKRAKEQNNLTGYAVYNSKANGKDFEHAGDSIIATAKLLRENYLTPGAINFNGTSITGVNIDYCLTEDSSKTDYSWSNNIDSIAKTLEGIYNEYK